MLMSPCYNLVSSGPSKRIRYACWSRGADPAFPISGSRLTMRRQTGYYPRFVLSTLLLHSVMIESLDRELKSTDQAVRNRLRFDPGTVLGPGHVQQLSRLRIHNNQRWPTRHSPATPLLPARHRKAGRDF